MKRFLSFGVAVTLLSTSAVAESEVPLPHVTVWDTAGTERHETESAVTLHRREQPGPYTPSVSDGQSLVPPNAGDLLPPRIAQQPDRPAPITNGGQSMEPLTRPTGNSGKKDVGYALTEQCRASVSYKRVQLANEWNGQSLRSRLDQDLSLDPDRDVVGLNMDWNLGRSSVGVGYRLESSRGAPSEGSSGLLPSSERVDHGVTIGISRNWGGAD